MQIENDYDKEVYNGDIGTINRVDTEAGEIVVTFDGRSVTYGLRHAGARVRGDHSQESRI
jgi:exodeoxyribonuclease V alpha subunit